MKYDLVIIGSGAAGLAAALYAGRYKMTTLVIAGEFGGGTSTAVSIENYPGVKAIDGYDLMKIMKEQAQAVGAEIKDGKVVRIEPARPGKMGEGWKVTTEEGDMYEASAVI